VNGQALTAEEKKLFSEQESVPACVKQCPAGALRYGDRSVLLSEAKTRIKNHPERYVDQIYGEHEAGGTSTVYLSSVPFAELGFPQVGTHSYPALSAEVLHGVPLSVIGVGAILGGTYAVYERRAAVLREEALHPGVSDAAALPAKPVKANKPHVEFAPVPGSAINSVNVMLLCLAALGGLSFLLRFALGLGGSTHLSDTYAWGLWIAFDFVWISIAAGAFATAGLIYIQTVEHFSRHFHRSPYQLGPEQIRQYQAGLFTRWKLAPNTVTQRLAAFRFFYVQVLKRGWSVAETLYPKKVLHLPQVLSQEEVARLIDAADCPFQRILLMTLYATGARRAEVAHLKISDIDSQRMVIHIRGGKGRKDRDVMLSPKLLDAVRGYWRGLKRKPTAAPRPFSPRPATETQALRPQRQTRKRSRPAHPDTNPIVPKGGFLQVAVSEAPLHSASER
jgi:hypothetical protein